MASAKKPVPADSTLISSEYGKLPSFTNQKFLSVHVKKGSNTVQIADAVSKALKAHDIPFFKDRTIDHSKPLPEHLERVAAGGAAGANMGTNSSDGLLILVQQEGP